MPSILKRFVNPKATPYQFPLAEELQTETKADLPSDSTPNPYPPEESMAPASPKQGSLDFAKLQAEAIMEAARQDAAEFIERAKIDIVAELEQLRAGAQAEGFRNGYAQGISHALAETQAQRAAQATQLGADVTHFLEKASLAQDAIFQQSQSELRDLSIAIAEKIVRVSLKNSGEVISRMILRSTEKLRRKEWVHIYIAGCDAKSFAQVSPRLTASLAALSDQVKIVPIADEESGTCMIEMPDEIIDASVSTQFSNIRDLLSDSYVQHNEAQNLTVR